MRDDGRGRRTASRAGRLARPAALAGAALLAAAASAPLASCQGDATQPSAPRVDSLAALPRALSGTEQEAIRAGNAFALSLLRATVAREQGNVLLSPLSVSLALGMTLNGADGATRDEMRRTLGWGAQGQPAINAASRDLAALLPSLDSTVTVRLANGVWVRQPLAAAPAFAADLRTYFGAEVRSAATPQAMFDAVNAWGSQQTEGLVPRVLSEPPPENLVMLLANAVYFAGAWRDRFDPAKTQPAPFRLGSGAEVQVPMMRRTGRFRGAQDGRVTAIELAYGNSAYSMLLLVPEAGSVAEYVATLDSSALAGVLARLQPVGESAELYLPRFTVKGSLELRPHLEQLGMPRAFSDRAEFPGLFAQPLPPVRLEFVRHGVALQVDERGTRAAAVTTVGVGVTSMPPTYRVDRPFVFLIRERFAGTLLFAGVVRDPRS